jgi:hypothetical protein
MDHRPPSDFRVSIFSANGWKRIRGNFKQILPILAYSLIIKIVVLIGGLSVLLIGERHSPKAFGIGVALALLVIGSAVVFFIRVHHWFKWLMLAALLMLLWFWTRVVAGI